MERSVSARGKAFAEPKPTFSTYYVICGHPESNPGGVNIGLAENVRNNSHRYLDTLILNICLEPYTAEMERFINSSVRFDLLPLPSST